MILPSLAITTKKLNYSIFIIQSWTRKLKPLEVFKAGGTYYGELVTQEMGEAKKTTRKCKLPQLLTTTRRSEDSQVGVTLGRIDIIEPRSPISVGQKSKSLLLKVSQGWSHGVSRTAVDCGEWGVFLRWMCFQAHWDCWQSSTLWGCMIYVPVSLLGVKQGWFSNSRGCLHVSWPSSSIFKSSSDGSSLSHVSISHTSPSDSFLLFSVRKKISL